MNIYLLIGAGAVLVLVATVVARRAELAAARRAEQQEAFEKDVERVRSGSGHQTFVRMQAEFHARVDSTLAHRDDRRRRSRRWRAWQTVLAKKVWPKHPPGPGYLILMGILTLVWGAMFLLIRSVDIYLLQSIGQTQATAAVFGTIIAGTYTVLGWFITGLLGMHSVLPPGLRLSRTLKTLVVGVLLMITVGVSLTMMRIAPYRSQSTIGTDLDTATAELAQIRAAEPVNAVQESVAAAKVEGLTSKLETAQRFDVLSVVVMPVVEILTSGALIAVLEASVVGAAGLFAAARRRAAERHDQQAAQVAQVQRAYAMRVIEEAGQDPEIYDRALQQITPIQELPPTSDPGQPNTGPDPTVDDDSTQRPSDPGDNPQRSSGSGEDRQRPTNPGETNPGETNPGENRQRPGGPDDPGPDTGPYYLF